VTCVSLSLCQDPNRLGEGSGLGMKLVDTQVQDIFFVI
jgi:hypothetical protein